MKILKSITICVCCVSLLLGCGNTKTGQSNPDATDSAQTLATHPRQEGVYYLSDLVDIIPGHTSHDEVLELLPGSGMLPDAPTTIVFPPTEDGKTITVRILMSVGVVTSVSYADDTHTISGKEVLLDMKPIPKFDRFSQLEPGQSSYRDVYEICNCDYGEFPQITGMKLVVPVYHNNEVVIAIDWKGTVASVTHRTTPESFEYPDHSIRRYNLADFLSLTPGQSAYEDLKAIYQEGGVYHNFIEEAYLFLPSENGNYLYFKMISGVIQEIRFSSESRSIGDELQVSILDDVTVSDFSKLIPTQSVCEDVSEICRQDLREYIGERGLRAVIPFAHNTQLTIDMDAEGIVTAVSYRLAPNEEQKTD